MPYDDFPTAAEFAAAFNAGVSRECPTAAPRTCELNKEHLGFSSTDPEWHRGWMEYRIKTAFRSYIVRPIFSGGGASFLYLWYGGQRQTDRPAHESIIPAATAAGRHYGKRVQDLLN